MSAWAVTGAKCQFIGGGSRHEGWNYPCKGKQYTIRATRIGSSGILIVLLNEVHNRVQSNGIEPGFSASYFRPVITRTQEQDVSMFKSLLNKTPSNETA